MLTHLSIRNLATVAHLELEPENGLTVMTGESGAGKSILIDALGLALGNRADSALVRNGTERAEVLATFDLTGCPQAQHWLSQHELDDEAQPGQCILRRTLRADGRSRAYINGTPMPVQDVRELGDLLISIHSQHEHQALLNSLHQQGLLDNYAAAADLAERVRQHWKHWQQTTRARQHAIDNAREQHDRQEMLRYQLEELDQLDLAEGELEQLDVEQKRLTHAEQLIRNSQQSLAILHEQEEATVHDMLGHVSQLMTDVARQDTDMHEVLSAIESTRLQVEAAADDIRRYLDRLELDPERLAEVEERLGACFNLARKYRIRPEELVAYHQQIRDESHTLEHFDEHLQQLEAEETQARQQFHQVATELSTLRRKHARQLSTHVTRQLKALGIAAARFEVTLEPVDAGANGLEHVSFLFSANAGQPLQKLAKVASGGELSRVSLAIQVVCAKTLTVPCMVFDEVDVGVGGGIAEVVGRLLRELGQHAQVLCITHQPQVAALGHHHWHIEKTQQRKQTHTHITALSREQRIEEMARMLGGMEITASTRAHAQEMLENSQAAL